MYNIKLVSYHENMMTNQEGRLVTIFIVLLTLGKLSWHGKYPRRYDIKNNNHCQTEPYSFPKN